MERRKLVLLGAAVLAILFGKEAALGALQPIIEALQIYMPARN